MPVHGSVSHVGEEEEKSRQCVCSVGSTAAFETRRLREVVRVSKVLFVRESQRLSFCACLMLSLNNWDVFQVFLDALELAIAAVFVPPRRPPCQPRDSSHCLRPEIGFPDWSASPSAHREVFFPCVSPTTCVTSESQRQEEQEEFASAKKSEMCEQQLVMRHQHGSRCCFRITIATLARVVRVWSSFWDVFGVVLGHVVLC